MRRVFVVGFPRSGTTLLQSVLISRFNLVSFTESHFYERKVFCPLELFDVDVAICDSLYLPKPNRKEKKFREFLRDNDIVFNKSLKKLPLVLDEAANHAGAAGWVEKTPGHIRRIPIIERECKDAVFIHIVRRFDPVFFSWEKASAYTGSFNAKKNKIKRKWIRDVQRSINYCTKGEGHYIVTYESLVSASNDFVSKISSDFSLETKAESPINKNAVKKIIRDEEKWKINNFSDKFLELKEHDIKPTDGYEELLYQQVKEIEKTCLK